MIGLLQRVTEARVDVDGETVGSIGPGLLVLVCAEPGDDEASTDKLLERLLTLRVFADDNGKMNLSLRDQGGGLLLVPQFTLTADTRKGSRPSFTGAAPPELARQLFAHMLVRAGHLHAPVAAGRFGAHMQVALTNDGPVTIWLQSRPQGEGASPA